MKAIVSRQYARAKKLLSENRAILDNMARVLVERETIYTAEVDMLMRGAGYAEVLSYMEEHDKGMPDHPFGNAEAHDEKVYTPEVPVNSSALPSSARGKTAEPPASPQPAKPDCEPPAENKPFTGTDGDDKKE